MRKPKGPILGKRHRRSMRMALGFMLEIWWLGKTKVFRSEARQQKKQSKVYAKQARIFRKTAMEMGGLIIKLGQHLSVRVDLLPTEYTEELSKLQDNVAPVDTQAIIDTIEQELEQPLSKLFEDFNKEPLAAASLAQVHEARLCSGERVAVKTLRPGIENIINTDLATLKAVLDLLGRSTKLGNFLDAEALYEEFAETIGNELDLVREGASAETVQRAFLENPWVDIPKIYWPYTAKRVLTMEFMEGVKINDVASLDAEGIDKQAIARHLLDLYLFMILEEGFFHADPHPGNVLVRSDGVILLLDFGMMGTLAPEMREGFIELITALFLKDATQFVAVLTKLGFVRKDVDTEAFEIAVATMLDKMVGGDPSLLVSSLEGSADELRAFMYEQPFQLPSNVTFLGKTLFTVTGLCLTLDPKIDFTDEIRPLAEELFGEFIPDSSLSGFLSKAQEYLKTFIPALIKLPTLIERMESGRLMVRIARDQVEEQQARQQAATQRIVRTIMGAVLFLSGVYVSMHAGFEVVGIIGLTLGALIMLFQTRPLKSRRRKRPRHPGL